MQIEKEIHNRQIQESFEHAMEYSPESFASVYMLYVPCKINGIDIKAFVDSGAQSTILSKSLAEKCSLMRLLDTRFSGIAKGVGTAKILGRIHLVQMKMGSHFFPCSLTVLDQGGVEFLFGLDMLKRHQACIDLKENVLKIGDEKIHFLSEKDLPDYAKERSPQHEEKSQVQPQVSANPPSSRPISATSSANPSSARQPAPAQQTSNSQFNESQIKVLTDLGFSRQDSLDALRLFNGNTEMAASYLFSKSSGLDF
jgi:DNA damage-inducible protein 1